MRTKTYNVFKFNELSDIAKEKAIFGQINFEIETMTKDSPYYPQAVKMENMRTPWFLASIIWDGCKDSIIETIKYNDYEFRVDGTMD